MIVVDGLSKRYRGTPVVDRATFSCEPGAITALLGPNGAGKSTTLRMLVGLSRPDAGTATIGGRRYDQIPNPTTVVGTLLDASAVHPGRSGRATLRVAAEVAGAPRRRVDELLDEVGLGGAATKRVGAYSLGMLQRLAVAQALIGDPAVLVLDEPTNGLDPEGMAWVRGLMRAFADRGGTVLVSSHLLREVEAAADRLVVIDEGRVVADGTLAEMLAGSGLVVRATDHAALVRMLHEEGLRHTVAHDGAVTVLDVSAEHLARTAVERGVLVVELRPSDRTGLEQVFLELTGRGADDGVLEGAS